MSADKDDFIRKVATAIDPFAFDDNQKVLDPRWPEERDMRRAAAFRIAIALSHKGLLKVPKDSEWDQIAIATEILGDDLDGQEVFVIDQLRKNYSSVEAARQHLRNGAGEIVVHRSLTKWTRA